jgi:hypothetical protein
MPAVSRRSLPTLEAWCLTTISSSNLHRRQPTYLVRSNVPSEGHTLVEESYVEFGLFVKRITALLAEWQSVIEQLCRRYDNNDTNGHTCHEHSCKFLDAIFSVSVVSIFCSTDLPLHLTTSGDPTSHGPNSPFPTLKSRRIITPVLKARGNISMCNLNAGRRC